MARKRPWSPCRCEQRIEGKKKTSQDNGESDHPGPRLSKLTGNATDHRDFVSTILTQSNARYCGL